MNCKQCENWKQRGDEQFDRAEQLQSILNHTEESNDELADRLRERDEEIARLQRILTDNGIEFQIECN